MKNAQQSFRNTGELTMPHVISPFELKDLYLNSSVSALDVQVLAPLLDCKLLKDRV